VALCCVIGLAPAQDGTYKIEIAAQRTAVMPRQEIPVTLKITNEGTVAGPSLDREAVVDTKHFVCAAPPQDDGGAASGKWLGEWAELLSEPGKGTIGALHPGESLSLPVLLRIPDQIADTAGVVYLEWKGRRAPLDGVRSNQLVFNIQRGDKPIASIETTEGTIVLELWPDKAPNHVANFITLAQKEYYDGLLWHRVMRNFMIQTGCPEGTGMAGPGYQIPDEVNDTSFKKGILGMAKMTAPNTAGSQFFVMVADNPKLDGNYCAFGRVVEGQEVADKISMVRVDGERPAEDVKMKRVRVALPKEYELPEVKKAE
jgi:peptidyl-prolyl cis-trans isomerase B (cyclophilin B)